MNKKARILLVDDQPMNVELLKAYLSPYDYELVEAFNGKEALEKVFEGDIDLIISDVMMPYYNGYEVTQKIRSDENTRLLPIILLTSLKDPEDRIKGIESGCDDFITKPFNENEVLARVKAILELSYYRRQLNEKDKFSAVMNEMTDGIIVCSPDWRVQEMNKAARNYLNASDLLPPDLWEMFYSQFGVSVSREFLMDTAKLHKTFILKRDSSQDVNALYLETRLDMLLNQSGELSTIIFTMRDITEGQQEERLKRDFLSLMSHKLRTPITGLIQSMYLISEGITGELNEQQRTLLGTIMEEAYSLRTLIEKLLGFTTINSTIVDLYQDTIDLCAYVPALVNSLTKQMKDKTIDFTLNCPGLEAPVKINRVYLDLILENLIENAVKFTRQEKVKISVFVSLDSSNIYLRVKDEGQGIPPEEKEKIFETFYQIEKDFTGNVEGPGLGLALVKRLVDAYNGSIEVTSVIDEGSEFAIVIPLKGEE